MLALITLLLGMAIGSLLAIATSCYLIKIKCPKCKKLKLLKEIVLFHWKRRAITGHPCSKCRQTKPQIDI